MNALIAAPEVRRPREGRTPLFGLTQQWQMLCDSRQLSSLPAVLVSKDRCFVRDLSDQLVGIRKAMMTTRFLVSPTHSSSNLKAQDNARSNQRR